MSPELLYLVQFPKKNAFLCFMQKFEIATKKWRENNLLEKSPVHSADTLGGQTFC